MPRIGPPLLVLSVLLAAALPAGAQGLLSGPALAPQMQDLPPPALLPPPVAARGAVDERIAFNDAERWQIRRYFERLRDSQVRAGRNKIYARALPAGLKTSPVKGDLIPLGVLAQLHRLPAPLQRDLPRARPDTERVVVGADVVLVRPSTGEVLDRLDRIIF